jgi:hypothetical protein
VDGLAGGFEVVFERRVMVYEVNDESVE